MNIFARKSKLKDPVLTYWRYWSLVNVCWVVSQTHTHTPAHTSTHTHTQIICRTFSKQLWWCNRINVVWRKIYYSYQHDQLDRVQFCSSRLLKQLYFIPSHTSQYLIHCPLPHWKQLVLHIKSCTLSENPYICSTMHRISENWSSMQTSIDEHWLFTWKFMEIPLSCYREK